jgi:hypothetical protein
LISVIVKAGTLMTVVIVYIDPADEERRDVVNEGQFMTSGVGRGDGGKIKVQSPLHTIVCGPEPQIEGGK